MAEDLLHYYFPWYFIVWIWCKSVELLYGFCTCFTPRISPLELEMTYQILAHLHPGLVIDWVVCPEHNTHSMHEFQLVSLLVANTNCFFYFYCIILLCLFNLHTILHFHRPYGFTWIPILKSQHVYISFIQNFLIDISSSLILFWAVLSQIQGQEFHPQNPFSTFLSL